VIQVRKEEKQKKSNPSRVLDACTLSQIPSTLHENYVSSKSEIVAISDGENRNQEWRTLLFHNMAECKEER
jgi:hypothetical protein